MAVALEHPEMLASCTIVDIAPVAYRTSEPQWTQIEAIVKKSASIDPSTIRNRKEGSDLLAPEVPASMRPFVMQNLVPNGENGYRWRCNINTLRDSLDQMAWFWDHPPQGPCVSVPIRFIRGSESGYVADKYRTDIDRFFPRARMDTVEGASHWVHADRPVEFVKCVEDAVRSAEARQ